MKYKVIYKYTWYDKDTTLELDIKHKPTYFRRFVMWLFFNTELRTYDKTIDTSQFNVAQSQGGQAVSVEERILFLAESPDCNHPRELRAIAFQVRKLEDRIKQLESENDALRADLLLWEEKEAKP